MVRSAARSAPIGLYTTSLLHVGVVQRAMLYGLENVDIIRRHS